ncbi:MAG: DUF6268 family outer membrane beta-barrel protein [Bacteroidota bacterium]
MKNFLSIVVFHTVLGACLGQEIELLGMEYARYPSSKVTTTDSLEASFTEYEVAALFPAVREEKFNLLLGGTYRLVAPEGNDRLSEANLFFLGANIIGSYSLSGNKQLVLVALPAASTTTDSRGITSDNFLMQGALLFRKKVSESFSYTIGALSTSRFGSPIVIPSLGLSHTGEKMKLDINLPFLIRSIWNYQNPFSYGLKLSVNGSQYNFDEESFSGDQVDVANFSRIRIGPELQYRVKGPLVFTLYGGIAANRTYEFELNDGDKTDFSLDNGSFVSFRLSLKPQPKTIKLFQI